MSNENVSVEEDVRLKMLNTFMTCTHRDTDSIKDVHRELQEADPVFYSHLACWYRKNGELRDHNEVFTACLLTDSFTENREVGLGLFQEQALYMKRKILGTIKGKKVKLRNKTGRTIVRNGKRVNEVTIQEKTVGLRKNVPNSLKTEVRNYLRWLEADNARFDAAALKNRADLKALYASLKVKPGERANDILFKGKVPEDSKLTVFEEIANAKSARKIATLLVEHKVPYTTAIGLVDNITPAILTALVNNMSPQEVINNIASLEEKGAMNNAGIKAIIEEKLEKAKKAKNVSSLKSKTAKDTGRVQNAEIAKKLDDVADEQVRNKAGIKVNTAVFVDASSSMHVAIEIGKRVAALISGATVADLYVVSFDTMPREIKAAGKNLSDWEHAFRTVRPTGCTSIGCSIELLRRNKQSVDQVVLITDEGENSHPMFAAAYQNYCREMNVTPNVVLINPVTGMKGQVTPFELSLTSAGIEFERFYPATEDYYGLPGLLPLLSQKSKLDLLMEIMSTPLKRKKEYK